MKKIRIITLACAGLLTASCDFLNVDDYFEDTFSEDKIFDSQYNIERYFNGAVNELPKEGRMYYWCSVPGATGSDEAVSCGTFYNGILGAYDRQDLLHRNGRLGLGLQCMAQMLQDHPQDQHHSAPYRRGARHERLRQDGVPRPLPLPARLRLLLDPPEPGPDDPGRRPGLRHQRHARLLPA